MIHVYKASAGAGKTYVLTQEYLKLLFQNQKNFRQTLAVTFTNKASAEMKHRIIASLYELAYEKDSSYFTILEQTIHQNKEFIRSRAQDILHEILHNYSFFFIETIDSFFQRVIRNFAKECNLYSSYSLELNQSDILEKAVLQMFLELSKDHPVFQIIRDLSDYKIEEGKSRNIMYEIISYCSILFNEQYMMYAHTLRTVDLPEYFTKLSKVTHEFDSKLQAYANAFVELMNKFGLQLDDFANKKRGFIAKLSNFQYGYDEKNDFTAKQFTDVYDISLWYSKSSNCKTTIEAFANAGAYDVAIKMVHMIQSDEMKAYLTAQEILKQKYLIQILHQVQGYVDEYVKQQNMFLISNTNSLLASLINEHDAPFVYEKIGWYIKNLMIDEFQDTSRLQWNNFLPLIQNVVSEGGFSLAVGDVKQSIYRFRNGDWRILQYGISEAFPQRIQEHELTQNWRSRAHIIDFNNALFHHAIQQAPFVFQEYFDEGVISGNDSRCDVFDVLYSDVKQLHTPNTKQGGYVRVERIGDDEKITTDEYDQLVSKSCIDFIIDLHKSGYKPEDIAFLVPKNTDISKIVSFCSEAQNMHPQYAHIFSVVSSEALKLHTSDAVQFIIAFFQWIDTPYCSVTRTVLLRYYGLLVMHTNDLLPITYFSEIESVCKRVMRGGSMFEIADLFIKEFNLGTIPEEAAFIHALQDFIYTFSLKQVNSIRLFLEWWNEKHDTLYISQPETKGAMRAMTIHKSKGLQFKVVIMPFTNWAFVRSRMNRGIMYTAETDFNELPVLPVSFTKGLAKTQFAEQYISEIMQVFLDNINKLYVACTRAEDVLYMMYSPTLVGTNSKASMSSFLDRTLTSLSQETPLSLQNVNLSSDFIFEQGTLPIQTTQTSVSALQNVNNYKVFQSHANLLPLPEARAFFSHAKQYSSRTFGVLMHRVLEHVVIASDVSRVISEFVVRGEIEISQQNEIETYIVQKISDKTVSEWFSGKYKVLSEQSILLPNAKERRPDRIMLQNTHAIIVDYKFTEHKDSEHVLQVSEYKTLLEQMGYAAEGFVWYCMLDEVVAV